MNGFATVILRAVGIHPIHGGEIHTEEELKMIITEKFYLQQMNNKL